MLDQWNAFKEPRPYVTVSGIAIDGDGMMALLHRSDKVRSARNCWSLPSGLHEVGLTMPEQFAAELKEELNLEAAPECYAFIGDYENIRPDGPDVPGWHWVIKVMVMRVKSMSTIINSEPDKHDILKVCKYDSNWMDDKVWAPKLGEFLHANAPTIMLRCSQISKANIW